MKKVCSTKKLKQTSKASLEKMGVGVVDYNAIEIKYLEFDMPKGYDYMIFTSQNAVKSHLRQFIKTSGSGASVAPPCFCVGTKTRILLEKKGYNVLKMADDSLSLAKYLAVTYQNASFIYLCGSRRRKELPDFFKENNIPLKEVVTYESRVITKKIHGVFDGVLFFSPSGVESFFSVNATEGIAFCIGATTAQAAKRFTKNIAISEIATTQKLLELTGAKLYEPGIC